MSNSNNEKPELKIRKVYHRSDKSRSKLATPNSTNERSRLKIRKIYIFDKSRSEPNMFHIEESASDFSQESASSSLLDADAALGDAPKQAAHGNTATNYFLPQIPRERGSNTDVIQMPILPDTQNPHRHESLEITDLEPKMPSLEEDHDNEDQRAGEKPVSWSAKKISISEIRRSSNINSQRLKLDSYNPLNFGAFNHLRATELEISNNIHILGTGNIGKFIAHSIAGMFNPPQVTLLLHSARRIEQWYEEGQAITMYGQEEYEPQTKFVIESSSNFPFDPDVSYSAYGPDEETSIVPPTSIIDHLIITTKVTSIISALESVKSRLRPTSTICFIHNGMGTIEEVNELVFPDPLTRPHYILGTISHGVGSVVNRKFSCTFEGSGAVNLCKLDSPNDDHPYFPAREITGYAPTARFILRTLTRCDPLQAQGFSYPEFLPLQLEKLAINAVINPLTVLFDCPNGALLYNKAITLSIQSLLSEISQIILTLPDLKNKELYTQAEQEALEAHFSPKSLYPIVVEVCKKTGGNLSSTLQDVKVGRETEIRWINGCLSKWGTKSKVATTLNDFMVNLVEGKQTLAKKDRENQVPFWKPVI